MNACIYVRVNIKMYYCAFVFLSLQMIIYYNWCFYCACTSAEGLILAGTKRNCFFYIPLFSKILYFVMATPFQTLYLLNGNLQLECGKTKILSYQKVLLEMKWQNKYFPGQRMADLTIPWTPWDVWGRAYIKVASMSHVRGRCQ